MPKASLWDKNSFTMQNILPSIKGFKELAKSLVLLVIFATIGFVAIAQNAAQVSITVNILPPYSPYYSDYSGANAGKVLLIIRNLTNTQKRIKLTGEVVGNNGIKVSTKSTYVPLQPIILLPNETKQLNGAALKDIFDLNSLNVYGVDKVKLVQTSRLPEGDYTFCLQAVDMSNNQIITNTAPQGCTSFSVKYPEAPILINPATNNYIKPTTVPNFIFTWINAGVVPINTQYTLQVAEMPLTAVDPNQVLNAVSFPIVNKKINATSYTYLPSDPILKLGQRYAWRVQAVDLTGKVAFRNDGKSAAAVFTYGEKPTPPIAQELAKLLVANPSGTNAQITVTKQNPLNFSWFLTKQSELNQKNLILDTNLYKAYNIKRYNVVVSTKVNGAFITLFTSTLRETNGVLLNNFKKSKTEALAMGFVDKKEYRLKVQALDSEGKLVVESFIAPFTFNIGQDVDDVIIVKVKTKLRYTFEGKPGDYPVAKTPVTVKVVGSQRLSDGSLRSTFAEASAETDAEGNLVVDVPIKKKYALFDFNATMTIANAYYGSKNLKRISIPTLKTDVNIVDLGTQFSNVYAYGLKLYVQKEFPTFKVENQNKSYLTNNNEQSEFGYDEKGNLVYNVKTKEHEAGVNIRLYRKGKQAYIPPSEGTVQRLGLIKKELDVLIAEGKTQLETVNGVTKSYVKFEKLLCNIYEGDEYYALATGATNVTKLGGVNGSSKYFIKERSEQAFGNGYTASEKTLRFLPKQDIPYSEFEDTYTIISNKPPQSVVSGRISYQWLKNDDKIRRAYANQPFQIKIGYRFKNNDGTYEYLSPDQQAGSGEENYFVKETGGSKTELVLLRDQGIIAGNGVTDATGRFTIQIDNLGYKGDLGVGTVYRTKNPLENWQQNKQQQPTPPKSPGDILAKYTDMWSDPYGDMGNLGSEKFTTVPYDSYSVTQANLLQSEALNTSFTQTPISGAAGQVNIKKFGVKASTQIQTSLLKSPANWQANLNTIDEVKLSGPSAPEIVVFNSAQKELTIENSNKYEKTGVLERVFIVEPVNYHLYPCEQPLIVQPFGAKDGGDFIAPVWETRLTVKVQDAKGIPLNDLKVIFFRTKAQKFPGMPLGEGDNQYKSVKLVNPQIFNTNNAVIGGNKDQALALNGIYNQEFERLWEGITGTNGAAGSFVLPYLLAGTDYYMQVTSQPDKSTITYKANIQYIDRMAEGDQSLTVTLSPLPSRIAGRVLEDGQSQRAVNLAAVTISNDKNYKYLTYTDKEGYFEVLSNAKNLPALPLTKLTVNKEGYTDNENALLIKDKDAQQYFKLITLKLGALAKGWVADANKSTLINNAKYKLGVDAYIRRKSNGAMVTTSDDPKKRGYYEIGIPSVKSGQSLEELEIIPLDVAYFKEEKVTAQLSSINSQAIGIDKRRYDVVYSRSHREQFVILDQTDNKPIPKVSVQIDGYKAISDANGIANFDFENVSVNNYKVIFTADKTQDYIPKIYELKSEEGRSPTVHYITMKKGNTIAGKVTLDGNPLSGAKVYLEFSKQNSSFLTSESVLIETRSGKDGTYTLKGVPINPALVNVIASLDTNFTVIGDKKPGNNPNLALTSFKQGLVKSLHGFPISVEEMKPNGVDLYKITGIVDLSKGATPFKMNQKDAIVRVRNITYRLTNGRLFPVENAVPIEGVSNITFRYLDKYNVLLSTKNTSQLTITKTGELGEISGSAKIIDNSFKYPSTYLNFNSGEEFYLADKVSASVINNKISAIIASTTDANFLNNVESGKTTTYPIVPRAFNISNVNGQAINFQFIEVKASANPLNTYVATDGKIHLNVNLSYVNVPNIQPSSFTVELKDVVLDNEKVEPGVGAPIILKLEDWTLKVDKWRFDPEKGGIFSETALLQTAKLDIPIMHFNLRKDMMVFDKIDAKGLKLGGGVANIEVISPKNVILVYDTKTGSDMAAHWRLSIAGSGDNPAANIKSLKNIGDLKVSYLQVLSNNESILSLANNNPVISIAGNTVAKFTAQTITNNPDNFNIEGSLDLNAPRMAPFNFSINYNKTDKDGYRYNNVNTEFEGKGYVHFIASNAKIDITTAKVTIAGIVQEKPNPTFDIIPATFIAEGNGYKVNLPANHLLKLSNDGSQSFLITSGGMSVTDKDWSILSFSGNLISKADGLKDKPSPMTFNVYGDVQVDGNGLNAGTETPFGAFKMVYDFNKGTLLGSLNFPKTSFGAYEMAGNLEMMIGSKGFYLLGSGMLNTAIPVVGGGYTVGFLISSYKDGNDAITPQMWSTLQAFQLNKNDCFFTTNRSTFKGVYLTAGRSLIDKSIDFDFVLVAGYLEAKAAVELSIWTKFGNSNPGAGTTISASGRVRAGMSAITGTSLSGNAEADAIIEMQYDAMKGFGFSASAFARVEADVSQSLVFTTLHIHKSIGVLLQVDTANGFTFDIGDGVKGKKCL
jgi:hypothetical protein